MTHTAKHTPGPWSVDNTDLYLITSDRDGEAVCEIAEREIVSQSGRWETNVSVMEANAHLIAAAPAMYAALEHAAMSCHHPACKCKGEYASQPERYCTCHVQKARQALAQAEGK